MKTRLYRYIITAALAVMTLTGCSNEENSPETAGRKECPEFSAIIGGAQTRVSGTFWEKGDAIGISGAGRTNVCHLTSEGDGAFTVKTDTEQIYFPNEDEVTFTAYHPWNELTDGGTAVKADTKLQDRQKSFDFLWTKATGKKNAPNVEFTFSHIMTKLSLSVKPGDDMTYDDVKGATLSLKGLRHSGSFSISDGSVSVEDAPEGDGVWTFSGNQTTANFDDAAGIVTYSLILFPQEFTDPLKFLAELNLPGDKTYHLEAEIDFTKANSGKDGESAKNECVSGRQYNLSLTLHRTGIAINKSEINPWSEVTGDEIKVD